MDLWEAFDAVEGLGNEKILRLLARICEAIYAVNGQEMPLTALIPGLVPEAPAQTPEQQIAIAGRIAAAANASA